MPLRAGEFVRPYMIRQKGKVSVAAATGTVGAERIIDGLYPDAAARHLPADRSSAEPPTRPHRQAPDPGRRGPGLRVQRAAGLPCRLRPDGALLLAPGARPQAVEKTLGVVSPRLAAKVGDFVARTADGLKFLPNLRHFGPFLLETTIYWGCNGLSMWILARGCGIENISIAQAFVVMGVLGVGILVPAGPGLFGAFQASIYAAPGDVLPRRRRSRPGRSVRVSPLCDPVRLARC